MSIRNHNLKLLLVLWMFFGSWYPSLAQEDTLYIPISHSSNTKLFYNYLASPHEKENLFYKSKWVKGVYILDFRPDYNHLRLFPTKKKALWHRKPWLFKDELDTLAIPLWIIRDNPKFSSMTVEEIKKQPICVAVSEYIQTEVRFLQPLVLFLSRKHPSDVYYTLNGQEIKYPYKDYRFDGRYIDAYTPSMINYNTEYVYPEFARNYRHILYQKNNRWIIIRENEGQYELIGGLAGKGSSVYKKIDHEKEIEQMFKIIDKKHWFVYNFCKHRKIGEPLFRYFLVSSELPGNAGMISYNSWWWGNAMDTGCQKPRPLKGLSKTQQDCLDRLINCIDEPDIDLYIRPTIYE